RLKHLQHSGNLLPVFKVETGISPPQVIAEKLAIRADLASEQSLSQRGIGKNRNVAGAAIRQERSLDIAVEHTVLFLVAVYGADLTVSGELRYRHIAHADSPNLALPLQIEQSAHRLF